MLPFGIEKSNPTLATIRKTANAHPCKQIASTRTAVTCHMAVFVLHVAKSESDDMRTFGPPWVLLLYPAAWPAVTNV
jgi:hypothetical protein